MFRCALRHTSKPKEKRTLVPLETRVRESDGGSEIVKEVPLCPKHLAEHEAEQKNDS